MIGRRRFLAGLGATLTPGATAAQGFAGLDTGAGDFALPRPDPDFVFPRDHAAHPAFRIEWWYVTANLQAADGRAFGAQWTLFRSALRPEATEGWSSPQIWFAHAAVTSADAHLSGETYARDGIGQAGVTAAPFHAWINDWSMSGQAPEDADALDAVLLDANGPDFAYTLDLAADGPLVFHGAGGYSVKSPDGQASYYYSQPHYRASGTLDLPSGEVPVTGRAWLDREWSSQVLSETQTGWDWIALHLDGGAKLMVGRVRDRAGPDHVIGTWIGADRHARYLRPGTLKLTALAQTRVAGRTVPTAWRIEWPDGGLDVTTAPLNPRSWMETTVAYWEGPITASGSHAGKGYLEMTGYE